MHLKLASAKMAAILSRRRLVKSIQSAVWLWLPAGYDCVSEQMSKPVLPVKLSKFVSQMFISWHCISLTVQHFSSKFVHMHVFHKHHVYFQPHCCKYNILGIWRQWSVTMHAAGLIWIACGRAASIRKWSTVTSQVFSGILQLLDHQQLDQTSYDESVMVSIIPCIFLCRHR